MTAAVEETGDRLFLISRQLRSRLEDTYGDPRVTGWWVFLGEPLQTQAIRPVRNQLREALYG